MRIYRRKRRPPRAKAKLHLQGFTAAELGAKVGVSARTVRYYTAQRLLPVTPFRGSATRYLRAHLVHLAAIRTLQRDRRLSLRAIRLHLESLSAADIERLAIASLAELAPPEPQTTPPVAAAVSDVWHRLTVLPGVEIHLHSAASWALAQGIVQRLRGG